MKEIRVSGKNSHLLFTVDDEDYDRVMQHKWYVDGARGYLMAKVTPGRRGKRMRIHTFLMNPPEGMQVDHIDGDKLNNCKSNLRICTNRENNLNKGKQNKRGITSKYKGVNFDKKSGKWLCRILIRQGKQKNLGLYKTELEAALVYDKNAKIYHGEFAKLNFP